MLDAQLEAKLMLISYLISDVCHDVEEVMRQEDQLDIQRWENEGNPHCTSQGPLARITVLQSRKYQWTPEELRILERARKEPIVVLKDRAA